MEKCSVLLKLSKIGLECKSKLSPSGNTIFDQLIAVATQVRVVFTVI